MAEGYVDNSMVNKKKTAERILGEEPSTLKQALANLELMPYPIPLRIAQKDQNNYNI